MAVLVGFADVFFFYDSITLLALNKVNQGQFSADTVPRVDSLDTSFITTMTAHLSVTSGDSQTTWLHFTLTCILYFRACESN